LLVEVERHVDLGVELSKKISSADRYQTYLMSEVKRKESLPDGDQIMSKVICLDKLVERWQEGPSEAKIDLM